MNIINKSYNTLEFNIIKSKLAEYAHSEKVKDRIHQLEPYLDEKKLMRHMQETTQAKQVIQNQGNPPLASMIELNKVITKLTMDAMLQPEDLEAVSRFVTACIRTKKYLNASKDTNQEIAFYADSMYELTDLKGEIDNCIRYSKVDDSASAKLAQIRKKINRHNDNIKSRLAQALSSNKSYYSEAFVATKYGRFTLPVKKEFKNRVSGTIVDTSKSGNTYFIEPSFIKKIQDTISQLSIEEDEEQRCILYVLTALVEDELNKIKLNVEAMETLDFIFAKAKLSIDINGVSAEISQDRQMKIVNGRHPLLLVDNVVPLNVEIGKGTRGIIITGPNTGGKTVTLKTIGLFSIMAQTGLHVPAQKYIMSMNNMVLCDIGDGQSITENLSTFSSHITNIIQILDSADENSMVLLDELGSGTDPQEGMGLAIAILNKLHEKKCMMVATTHYPQVKEYAQNKEGLINAKMAFDRKNLVPLYRLEVGEAGQSCALYIAKRLGLDKDMIRQAHKAAYSNYSDQTAGVNLDFLDEDSEIAKPKEKVVKRTLSKAKVDGNRLLKDKFQLGDSVCVSPDNEMGIIFEKVNRNGEVGVIIKRKRYYYNHKRVKLMIPANELYPENYDLSVVLDTVENRKAQNIMRKRHDKNAVIVISEGEE